MTAACLRSSPSRRANLSSCWTRPPIAEHQFQLAGAYAAASVRASGASSHGRISYPPLTPSSCLLSSSCQLAELKGTLEELDKFARERESESESDDGSSSSSSEDDDADCLGEEETEEDRKRRAAWIAHYVETGQLQMAIDLGWEKQEDEEDEAAEEAGVRETTRDDNLGENQTDQQNTSHVKTAAPALTVSVDGAPTVAMEPSPTILTSARAADDLAPNSRSDHSGEARAYASVGAR